LSSSTSRFGFGIRPPRLARFCAITSIRRRGGSVLFGIFGLIAGSWIGDDRFVGTLLVVAGGDTSFRRFTLVIAGETDWWFTAGRRGFSCGGGGRRGERDVAIGGTTGAGGGGGGGGGGDGDDAGRGDSSA